MPGSVRGCGGAGEPGGLKKGRFALRFCLETTSAVMAGLGPATHDFPERPHEDVGARAKPGHDNCN
jgi:hypothetical protein